MASCIRSKLYLQSTKFAYFLENPIDKFRVPIAYSYGNNNTLLRHPGNTRYMSMMAMPDHVGVRLLITDFERNKELIEQAKLYCTSKINLAECIQQEIIELFDFPTFHGVSVRYSNQVGIQLVESHSRLPEFYESYTISFTGSALYVNETLVAQQCFGKKINESYFYMPGTKHEYLQMDYEF